MDKYYLALGMFVDSYASAEDAMFMLLQHVSGIPDKECRAVFSGVRVKTAADFVARLYETRNEKVPPRLAEVFLQIRAITGIRDHILHSGTREQGGELVSVNALKAHAPRALKSVSVTPEFMNDLTFDLETIFRAITVHIAMRDFAHEFTDPNHPKAQQLLASSLVPWRYKRP